MRYGFDSISTGSKAINFAGKTLHISRYTRDMSFGERTHSCTLFIREDDSNEEIAIKVPFFPDYPASDITVTINDDGCARLLTAREFGEFGADACYIEETERENAAFYYAVCSFLSFEDISTLCKENGTIAKDFFKNPFCLLKHGKGPHLEEPYATFPRISSHIQIPTFAVRLEELRACANYVLSINEDEGNTLISYEEFEAEFIKILKGCGHPIEKGKASAVLAYYSEDFYIETPVRKDSVVARRKTMEMERYIKNQVMSCLKSDTCFGRYNPSEEKIGFLSDEQKEAVKGCVKGKGRLSILTGGPGTGKTTVIGTIAEEMKEKYPDVQVSFLSPTGMAAKRVREQTTLSGVKIMTIHKFLGWGSPNEEQIAKKNTEKGGLIVIDEASMLTLDIFYRLIHAVNLEDVKIILVGDVNQLPAIGAGNIMEDMAMLGVPLFRLTVNHRSAGFIGKNCEKIVNGIPKLEFGEDFVLKKYTDSGWVFAGMGSEDGCVISPFRKEGLPCSSSDANKVLRRRAHAKKDENGKLVLGKKALEKDSTPSQRDYVVINRTDYKLGYVNGESGILEKIEGEFGMVNTGKKVLKVLMDDLALGYSLTVHKSQGSEYGTVIITLPKASSFITRRMLYTAISRGKKKVIIYSTPLILFKTVLNRGDERRNTFVSTFGAEW